MVRDFSNESLNKLLGQIQQIQDEQWCGFTDWLGDRAVGIQWKTNNLKVEDYTNNIDEYHKKVMDYKNVSADQIKEIFRNVHAADESFATRFAVYNTEVDEFLKLLNSLKSMLTPENFVPGKMTANFDKLLKDYKDNKVLLDKLANEGLEEADLKDMDPSKVNEILNTLARNLIPSVSGSEKGEFPIGPGLTYYYEVTVTGNPDSPISTVVEEQKLELESINFSGKAGGTSSSVTIDKEGQASVTMSRDGASISVNEEDMSYSYSQTIGSNEYKAKMGLKPPSLYYEESVTTKGDGWSVETKSGIKLTPTPPYVPVTVPAYVPDTWPVPSMGEVGDWISEHGPEIAIGTVIVVGVVVLVFVAPEALPVLAPALI